MPIRLLSCRLYVVGWLLLGGWLLTSCQTGVAPTSHLNQETISLNDLLKRLVFRQSGMTDLKSFVYTTIEKKDKKRSFRQALVVREADSLRIETLNILGQPLGVYIFNGRNTAGHRSILYDPRRSRILLGKEVRSALEQTLGMDLNLGEYISVFYGNIPRLEFLKMTSGSLNEEGTVYWLTGVDPADQSHMEIEIDAFTLLPNEITRTLKNGKTIRVKWQDYREIKGRDFPYQIIIEFPSRDERLTLVYTDPVLNAGVEDDTFQLSPTRNNVSLSKN
jgi:outer membrane lipoprotein-sorting protein